MILVDICRDKNIFNVRDLSRVKPNIFLSRLPDPIEIKLLCCLRVLENCQASLMQSMRVRGLHSVHLYTDDAEDRKKNVFFVPRSFGFAGHTSLIHNLGLGEIDHIFRIFQQLENFRNRLFVAINNCIVQVGLILIHSEFSCLNWM